MTIEQLRKLLTERLSSQCDFGFTSNDYYDGRMAAYQEILDMLDE